jgi:hypothetical protein
MLTCDTYTSVVPEIAHRSAEATARLVLAAARKLRTTYDPRGDQILRTAGKDAGTSR